VTSAHHPFITKRANGTWEVKCPDCELNSFTVPIGIGTAVDSLRVAQRLRDNHKRHTSRSPAHRTIPRPTNSCEVDGQSAVTLTMK
jgi:hypothetical protein